MIAARSYLFVVAYVSTCLCSTFSLPGCSDVAGRAPTHIPVAHAEEVPVLDSRSPFEIERLINANPKLRIETIWLELGIAGKFNGLPGWGANARDFFAQCQYCEAEASRLELDGKAGDEVLLRVEDRLSENSRFLVYEGEGDGGLRYIGNVDHNFGRYSMPQHSVFRSRGRTYLLVSAQTQSGSGVVRFVKRLFRIRDGVLEEVLSFPAEGLQSEFSPYPERKFAGRIVEVFEENDLTRVTLQLTVKYTLPAEYRVRGRGEWKKVQMAVYVKRSNETRAVLDESRSSLTQAEIDAVYDVDTLSDADLVKYNRKELRAARWRPPRS